MEEVFNTELFIDEVEKRPAIWDMTSSNYSDKILRRRAWEELVLTFCEGDDNEEKKKLLASSLQKKWKSLRDNYIREVKKMKTVKSGSGALKNSTYIHYNRLQFLQASADGKDTESSFDADNASAPSEVANAKVSPAFKSPKRKKQKLNPADERFANILEQSIAQNMKSTTKEDDDEDRLFCLSLVKEIKKVPASQRLRTKISIYNIILQNQTYPQEPQQRPYEIQNYQNPLLQRRNYLSQEQHSQTSIEGFQYHDYRSQQSSMPNNLAHYGYSTTVDQPSPTTSTHTPSPAPTNASIESEIELFCDN